MNVRILLLYMVFIVGHHGFAQTAIPVTIHIQPGDSVKTQSQGAAVAPFNETLFFIYASLGPFSPEQRAKGLADKIKELADNPFFNPDSLVIIEYEGVLNLTYGGMLVSTVIAGDSIAENSSKYSIAKLRLNKTVYAVKKYREMNSKENIIRSIGFSLLVVLLLILFFYIVNRLYHFLNKKIDVWQGSKKKVFTFLNYEFFDKNRQIIVFRFFNKLLRLSFFFFLLIIGLAIMFYLLPWTKAFTLKALQYLLTPVKNFFIAGWNLVPNLLTIIVIILITTYINRFFRFLKSEIEKGAFKIPGFYSEWALPTYNIIRVIVWIFTLIIIWPYIPGSDSKIFQGISVFLGLVFSLTSASLLSNVMAGFSLTYTRAFQIGDRIKIGDMIGDVVEKSMLVTKIKTIKNEEITIPNSKIMSSEVINYSTDAPEMGLILNTTVTIGYDAPWRKVHELLINAALSTEGILSKPEPFVFQTSLDDYYVSYQINAFTKKPNEMAKIYSDLHQNIQDKFNEGGVEIMSPAYRSVRDGNTTTIPEDFRGKDYESPGFRIDRG